MWEKRRKNKSINKNKTLIIIFYCFPTVNIAKILEKWPENKRCPDRIQISAIESSFRPYSEVSGRFLFFRNFAWGTFLPGNPIFRASSNISLLE